MSYDSLKNVSNGKAEDDDDNDKDNDDKREY